MHHISIDPVTRIEGHLKVDVTVDDGAVKEANCSGTMYRGFEQILKGRDPRDAQRLTQRVCGVCPTGHATASSLNLDNAFGVSAEIPKNGRIIRNLILGSNYLQSHILHFYHLAALDYVDVAAVKDYAGNDRDLLSIKEFISRGELAPFVPRYEGDYRFDAKTNQELTRHYVLALEIRKLAHKMLTIFGGKMPHNCAIYPGGVFGELTVDKITSFLWNLNKILDFINDIYLPDVLGVAKGYSDYFKIGIGCKNYLSYGAFDLESTDAEYGQKKRLHNAGAVLGLENYSELDASKIAESVKHSWYSDAEPLHPSKGQTEPDVHKEGAYSFLKSPRYDGEVYEVGPLARMVVSRAAGNDKIGNILNSALLDAGLQPEDLASVLGRHLARTLETKIVAEEMASWLLELEPGKPLCIDAKVPEAAQGHGLTEAPRGALGHFINIEDSKIANYQLVVPTTWNASPKDDNEKSGPIEQALIGTVIRDPENPFEVVRIVRSFDPCLACAIHMITPDGKDLGEYRVS